MSSSFLRQTPNAQPTNSTGGSIHAKGSDADLLTSVHSQCELILSGVVSLLHISHSGDIKCEFVKFLCFDSLLSFMGYVGCV